MKRAATLALASFVFITAAALAAPGPAVVAAGDARAHVDRWLAAQNKGDFAAYQSLYADRFEGIRRSGPRMVRLDRAGWLKDRARMFKKPMQVTTGDVRVGASSSSAVVSFEQRFASGNYQDAGPKQLVLAQTKDGLRIAREEMLSSRTAQVAKGDTFFPVIEDGVVLDAEPLDEWGTGPFTLMARSTAPVRVGRKVDEARLPDGLRARRKQSLRLFDARGPRCEIEINGLLLVHRVNPHFGTVQDWNSESAPISDAEVAKQAVSLAGGGGHVLVGTFAPQPACAGATWARASSLPVPAIATATPAPAALGRAVLDATRKLDAWRALQKSYQEADRQKKKTARWDEYGGAKPIVSLIKSPLGGPDLLSISIRSGSGCGDFMGVLWALFELSGAPGATTLTLKNDPAASEYTVPAAAADVDGDGRLELLFDQGTEHGILRMEGGLFQKREVLAVPDLDCPC